MLHHGFTTNILERMGRVPLRQLLFVHSAILLVACTQSSPTPALAPTTIPTPSPTVILAPTTAILEGDSAAAASDGDTVIVHYRGTLDSGEEFDSSRGTEPITFVVGAGQMIPGFDDAVRGLAVGEIVTVRLEPSQAYGDYLNELILELPPTTCLSSSGLTQI